MWISGCVAHVWIGLGLWLGLGMSHLPTPNSNMSQVVRWVLSRRVCHTLWGVVLVHASSTRCRWALHPTIVALRHLIASHLVRSTPRLCWRLLISWSVLLLRLLAPNSTPTSSSPSITWVSMVGVAGVSWVIMVVGSHAIYGCVHIRGSLAGTILGNHSSAGSTGLIVACVGAMVIHLPQFRLPWARPRTMDHSLVITPISLVLMAQRGITLLGKRVGLGRGRLLRKAVA